MAVALRETGRAERTLFAIEWVLHPEMRRRVQIGQNEGESRHALKSKQAPRRTLARSCGSDMYRRRSPVFMARPSSRLPAQNRFEHWKRSSRGSAADAEA